MDRLRCATSGGENMALIHAEAAGGDHIDIYGPARLDPQVPIEETVGLSPR